MRKLSPMVRQALVEFEAGAELATRAIASAPQMCAFVRLTDADTTLLNRHGCRTLARWGNLFIVSFPMSSLPALSCEQSVSRIEAGKSCMALLDTTAILVNAIPAWQGTDLPQAFTGKGVVVGVQDVGFDVTHPTFFSRDMTNYRVKRFWDHLSPDTLESPLYVGADYATETDILRYAHSRDGAIISHGTHTAGIAAGSGYDTAYRGIAWESDICLVSNTVTDDTVFIADSDRYKYTSATDVLGFKYLFDYAASVGKPCVVSFSEGSHQSFWSDDQLMHEALDSLVGPGRIFVASAGNEGHLKTYVDKPRGVESRGTFLENSEHTVFVNMRSDAPFTIRVTAYEGGQPYVRHIHLDDVCQLADSMLVETVRLGSHDYSFIVAAYPSFYDAGVLACELSVSTDAPFNALRPLSVEMVGVDVHAEMFKYVGTMTGNSNNPRVNDAVSGYSILSPGCARSAICVGGTAYRTAITNYRGETRVYDGRYGHDSPRLHAASIGPTFDNRVKPDVVANGANVISAYSSYYIEQNPFSWNVGNDVVHFTHNSHTYGWNATSGTSMSAPVVAGAIALWLQACPTLSPDDVKAILARSCRRPDGSMHYPNNYYGYGELDVYRGLLDILGAVSIPGVSTSQPLRAHFSLDDSRWLSVSFDGERQPSGGFTLSVYSLSGVQLLHTSDSGLSLSSLPSGIYVVQLHCRDAQSCGSTLIRL